MKPPILFDNFSAESMRYIEMERFMTKKAFFCNKSTIFTKAKL